MTFYQKTISKILNITNEVIICEVEEIMRMMREQDNSGCLDHLDKNQFEKCAKLAYKIYDAMQTDEYKKEIENFYNV